MTVSAQTGQHALRRRFERLLGIPATEGNLITVLRNGDEIPAMLDSIRSAQRTIDFLTFVYWRGDIAAEMAAALAERAAAGLRVRVLLDSLGGQRMERSLVRTMQDSGVTVECRKPWRISPLKQNHRTHRKLLICDETLGYTGGVGIAAEWTGDAPRAGAGRRLGGDRRARQRDGRLERHVDGVPGAHRVRTRAAADHDRVLRAGPVLRAAAAGRGRPAAWWWTCCCPGRARTSGSARWRASRRASGCPTAA